MPFNIIIFFLLGATFKVKNMPPPMGSIFFPLIVAPFKTGFRYVETYSTIQKLIFDDKDTNIY